MQPLDPEEERKLQAEWGKAKKWGASRSRERALAVIVSTSVGVVLFVGAVVLSGASAKGFVGGIILAGLAGGAVRAALMPKGQFS